MSAQRLFGPWLVLAVGIVAAVAAVTSGQLRLGGYLLAGTLAATALLRLTLPSTLVGALAVRSRTIDVIGLLLAAAGAAALTAVLKLTP